MPLGRGFIQRQIDANLHQYGLQPALGQLHPLAALDVDPNVLRRVREPPRPPAPEEKPKKKQEERDLPEGMIKSLLPPFKLPYTLDEIDARFRNSIILVRGNAYLVETVNTEADGTVLIGLYDDHQKRAWIKWDSIGSVRSVPPMYITAESEGGDKFTAWVARAPSTPRDNAHQPHGDFVQGLTGRNGILKMVGKTDFQYGFRSVWTVLRGLKARQDMTYDGKIEELLRKGFLSAIRLTDNVALFVKKGYPYAEYKGRVLGRLSDNRVILAEEDKDTPWICSELFRANLGTR